MGKQRTVALEATPENLKLIVRKGGPYAAVELLGSLGWHNEHAHVDHVLGTPDQYDRLLLGAELTGAGTQTTTNSDLWWTGFQQGARYHLSIVNQAVSWYDFQERLTWRAPWDGDLRPLMSLSPGRFSSTGTFTPETQVAESSELPEKPPREYLTDIVRDWFRNYLRVDAPRKQDGPILQRNFVNLIARLVLIRTIEDMGGREWLPPGTLKLFAESPRSAQGKMKGLFSTLQKTINSQVFSDGSAELPDASASVSLLHALYEAKGRSLDFSAIEFNMIGRFYERVLGEHYSLKDTSQLTIVGAQEREVTSISHRRELGQYYTPRAFADYIARKVILPRVRIAREVADLPRVADIAVGSGEMLNAALRVMLSVAKFRTPKSVRYILEEKLVGIDINPTATQLTALNILRTAVLLCPDLLEQAPAFPRIKGLYSGDANERMLKQVGQVDVVLTNPPFRGQPDWRDNIRGKLQKQRIAQLGGQTNKAGLFLLRAASMVRENGAIGIVLPNQFFSSHGNQAIRDQLVNRLDILELVDNQGSRIFDGVTNQPGILIAAVDPTVRTPRMLTTKLAPTKALEHAVLSTGLDNSPGISRKLLPKPRAHDESWLGNSAASLLAARPGETPMATLEELLQHGFSRAPIFTTGPLQDLFTVDIKDNNFVHRLSGVTFREDSPFLKKIAKPKKSPDGTLDAFSDENHRIFFPYFLEKSALATKTVEEWGQIDPSAQKACAAVVERALSSMPLRNRDHESYRQKLANGHVGFFRLMGFRPNKSYVLMSRMARIQQGTETWSGWAFSDSDNIVPASGLFAHTDSLDWARVLAVLLNTHRVFEQLRVTGTARGSGWVEVSPRAMSRISVPDLRSPALAGKLSTLTSQITQHRASRESGLSLLLPSAEGLWSK